MEDLLTPVRALASALASALRALAPDDKPDEELNLAASGGLHAIGWPSEPKRR